MESVLRSVGIHDGVFHADEVTASALLVLFNLVDKDKIVRTRDQFLLDNCEYVCDVGGVYNPEKKLFDHHQREYQGEMSSAGMVLNYLKEKGFLDKGLYHNFKKTLIDGIDAEDTGKIVSSEGCSSFSDIISNFLPIEYEVLEEAYDRSFQSALDFVIGHLERSKNRFYYRLLCLGKVKKSMKEGKDYLLFDEAIPWIESFFELGGENHQAKFIVMPTGKQWKLRTIPPTLKDKLGMRAPLPDSWSGLQEKELERVSGIKGAVFCHKGLFISIWQTKEAAMKALKKVIK